MQYWMQKSGKQLSFNRLICTKAASSRFSFAHFLHMHMILSWMYQCNIQCNYLSIAWFAQRQQVQRVLILACTNFPLATFQRAIGRIHLKIFGIFEIYLKYCNIECKNLSVSTKAASSKGSDSPLHQLSKEALVGYIWKYFKISRNVQHMLKIISLRNCHNFR